VLVGFDVPTIPNDVVLWSLIALVAFSLGLLTAWLLARARARATVGALQRDH
jgi:hypothetical protein